MSFQAISGGVVAYSPVDLRRVLMANPKVLAAWEDLTPLARNEWICWVLGPKKAETRSQQSAIAIELLEGTTSVLLAWLHPPQDKELSPSSAGCWQPEQSGRNERRIRVQQLGLQSLDVLAPRFCFLRPSTQQIHSLRARGVRSSHAARTWVGIRTRLKSTGTVCTTPPEIALELIDRPS